MYKPLPDNVTVGPSKIQGLGLIATKKIQAGTLIGKIHIPDNREPDGYIRTPLGGFVNHSEKPNCKLVDYKTEMHLYTQEDIKAGEELTLKYKLYDPVEIIDEYKGNPNWAGDD